MPSLIIAESTTLNFTNILLYIKKYELQNEEELDIYLR
jgi:hypothetical protein